MFHAAGLEEIKPGISQKQPYQGKAKAYLRLLDPN